MLRQVVGDRFPLGLGADKDVSGRANARRIDERSETDMDVLSLANHGVQERAALAASNVVIAFIAEAKQRCLSRCDFEFVALYPRKGLVRRAGGAPTLGAVTDERVAKLVGDAVLDRTAETLSDKA